MSAVALSCADDLFSDDLLCGEDSSTLSGDLPECSSEIELLADFEESIAGLIEDERKFVPGVDYFERIQAQLVDASARQDSVAWILKVQRYYGLHPLTAYLSVNYMDRFLYSKHLPTQTNGWPLQLLSVACLSLAAKMEECLVPSLLDIQVEGAKYLFEPKTIRRMEFLVLSVLDWRLRSVTPFSFLSFFAYKIDPQGTYTIFLISRATDIILSNIQEASFLEYRPSCIAAATILCAASDIPNLSLVNADHAESWCNGLRKEMISSCYRLIMQDNIDVDNARQMQRSKVMQHLRVMTRTSLVSSGDTCSSSSSSSSSSPSSFSSKRRRLNNSLWADDDRGSCD